MTAAIAIANIASTRSYGSSIAFEDFRLVGTETVAFGYPTRAAVTAGDGSAPSNGVWKNSFRVASPLKRLPHTSQLSNIEQARWVLQAAQARGYPPATAAW